MSNKIRKIKFDIKPTGFPELDTIIELIKLADKYAKIGDLEKSNELASKVGTALNKITETVIKENKEGKN